MNNRWFAVVLVVALLAATAACGSPSASSSATTPTGNRPTEPAPAGARAVVLQHGPMPYVMANVPERMHKAQTWLKASDLVAQLTAAGIAVTYQGDESQGYPVIVLAGELELGRADIGALDGESTPAALLDAIHAHFGATP